MRSCTLCPAKHHARGYCHTHYERWRLYGDPLSPDHRGGSRPGCKQPMDAWEKRWVIRLLRRGTSYRAIERATGVGYRTVCRFVAKLRSEGYTPVIGLHGKEALP
jgi:transposase-like protein